MAMLNNQMVIHINWIYWLQVLRIITALWHHLVTLQGPWHSPLPSLLPQGFRASPRCKGLHRRLTRKFWISLCNYMIYNTIYIYNIYIYMWTVESLFRICCLVNYSKSCVAVSSVSRKHGGELRSFLCCVGVLSQTLRLAESPLKYNGNYLYCNPI